jgi:hypothetical protein
MAYCMDIQLRKACKVLTRDPKGRDHRDDTDIGGE